MSRLAEVLDTPLLTRNRRLAMAAGHRARPPRAAPANGFYIDLRMAIEVGERRCALVGDSEKGGPRCRGPVAPALSPDGRAALLSRSLARDLIRNREAARDAALGRSTAAGTSGVVGHRIVMGIC